MKSFETAKDVLDHSRHFHRQLGELYARLSDNSGKERVKMLLGYLSRHEKHLDESLSQYEEAVSEQILNTWFQFLPPKETMSLCEGLPLEVNTELTVDGIVDLALKYDDCLIHLYEAMINSTESEQVRAVFNNLLEMEKREEVELVKNAFRLKGL